MLGSAVTSNLSHIEVAHRLHEWLLNVGSLDRVAAINEALASGATVPCAELLARFQAPEQQKRARFTHDVDLSRLKYSVWQHAAKEPVTQVAELRALLRRTSHCMLWRLASHGLFASLLEALFTQLQAEWPEGDISLSNVKDADGEGGKFELWLPAAAQNEVPNEEQDAAAAAAVTEEEGEDGDGAAAEGEATARAELAASAKARWSSEATLFPALMTIGVAAPSAVAARPSRNPSTPSSSLSSASAGDGRVTTGAAAAARAGGGVAGAADDRCWDPAEPLDGGLLLGKCTVQCVTMDEGGGQLELARTHCVVIVDLDRGVHCQQVVGSSVNPMLLPDLPDDALPEGGSAAAPAPRLLSPRLQSAAVALGMRQQHLARPTKVGWLKKRGQLLPSWRLRWCVLHHGTLRYWHTRPTHFGPLEEWSEAELREATSIDVIQLADATIVGEEDEHDGGGMAHQAAGTQEAGGGGGREP
jgi:hypothetical protein